MSLWVYAEKLGTAHFDVITQTTPNLSKHSNNRRNIIASTMSVTCGEEKRTDGHRSLVEELLWSNLKLIEAEDSGLVRQIPRYWQNWVQETRTSRWCFHSMYTLMYINHECMKMGTSLSLDIVRESIVKEIHQHALSGPDISVQV